MLAYFLLGRDRLRSYSVHEPANPAADRVTRAEALEFIKEGFVFSAFVLPPVWLAARGIWLGTLAYFAAAIVIATIANSFALSPLWPALALLAVHLIFGAEADELQRSHLAARGWSIVGHVTGTGALDCERRFFDTWLPSAPMTVLPPKPAALPAQSTVARTTPAGVLGNVFAPLKRQK